MSNIRKGQTVVDREWRQHLRPDGKRKFWRRQRAADRVLAEGETPPPKRAPKKKKRKRLTHKWGVRVHGWFTHWYPTEKQRDEAFLAHSKNTPMIWCRRSGVLRKLFPPPTKVER